MVASMHDLMKSIDALDDADRYDDLEAALVDLEGMKLADPDDYVTRGRFLIKYYHYHTAMADIEAVISYGTDNPEVYFDLGVVHSAMGRYEEAVEALYKTVKMVPDSYNGMSALCWELERLGRYKEAADVIHNYKRSEPNPYYGMHRHWGRICGRRGLYQDAFASYVKSIRLATRPDKLSMVPEGRKELVAICKTVEKFDPKDPRSLHKLGVLLTNFGWYEEAIDALSTGVQMRPEAGDCLLLGMVLEWELRMHEAIDVYKDGIRALSGVMPPGKFINMYGALVSALYDCGRYREALQYAAQVISLGVASKDLKEYCEEVQESKEPDLDQIDAGWTRPHYAKYDSI